MTDLLDLLPPGTWVLDPLEERSCVELLREGVMCVRVQVPADGFADLLRARLQLAPGEEPTYADWAMLRMALQDAAWQYLTSMTLPDFGGRQRWLTRLGEAGERPDMKMAHDAAITTQLNEQDREDIEALGDVLQAGAREGEGHAAE